MNTQTKTINAGPVGLKPKGDYSASATYTLLDCVFYNHDSWVCKAMNQSGEAATVTGVAPSSQSPYWQALTDGGAAAYGIGAQVRVEFNTWFGEDDDHGVRKQTKDAVSGAENVNAVLNGTVLTVTNRNGQSEQKDLALVWDSMSQADKDAIIIAVAEKAGDVATVEESRQAAEEITFEEE